MPAYVRRPHDELLRPVLDPEVPAAGWWWSAARRARASPGPPTRRSRAGSRTGGWSIRWTLPRSRRGWKPGSRPWTVLWLGELCQYADADGGAAALAGWPSCWPARATWSSPPSGPSSGLLTWPRRAPGREPPIRPGWPAAARGAGRAPPCEPSIPPAAGSSTSRHGSPTPTWKPRPGPATRCWQALRRPRAGHDGQVTQYLAGVPDLLRRYHGPGGDPYGQAVITAAMDATRLGHASPLPAALSRTPRSGT